MDVFDDVERRILAETAAAATLKAHREVLFGVAQEYELGEIAAYLGIVPEDVFGLMRFNRAIGKVLTVRTPAWAV